MATFTLTGDLVDLVGAPLPARALSARIASNGNDGVLVVDGKIHLGGVKLPLQPDGTFSLAGISAVEDLYYEVTASWVDPGTGKPKTQGLGWWPSPAADAVVDLAGLVTSDAMPIPEAAVVAQLLEARDETLAARDDVVAVVASNDGIVSALVDDSESLTSTALSATFGPKGEGLSRFRARAAAGDTLKVVSLGDSILEGQTTTTPATDTAGIIVAADVATEYGVTCTHSQRADSGTTVLMANTRGNVAAAIADQGDLYLVGWGPNDIGSDSGAYRPGYPLAASLAGFELVIRALREKVGKADIAVILTNPYAAGNPSNPYLLAHHEGKRRVAAAYGCEVIDVYQAFINQGDYSSLMADSTHPNTAGHALMAATILDHINSPAEVRHSGSATPPPSGLYSPERVAVGDGSLGYAMTALTGSYNTGRLVWTNTGSWTGAGGGADPYTTTTPGDYLEVAFDGTEAHVEVSTRTEDAAVVDVAIDGVTIDSNVDLTTGKKGTYFVPFATGLTSTTHTLRLTLVSGTLKATKAATKLNGSPPVPTTAVVNTLLDQASYSIVPTDGSYLDHITNAAIGLPVGWGSALVFIDAQTFVRIDDAGTTTPRNFNTVLRFNSVDVRSLQKSFEPHTASTGIYFDTVHTTHQAVVTSNVQVWLRTRLLSTDKTNCRAYGKVRATLIRLS